MTRPRIKTPLELATERHAKHNDAMAVRLLEVKSEAAERVADAPEQALEDATERARKFWDRLEAKHQGRRSSVPPKKP